MAHFYHLPDHQIIEILEQLLPPLDFLQAWQIEGMVNSMDDLVSVSMVSKRLYPLAMRLIWRRVPMYRVQFVLQVPREFRRDVRLLLLEENPYPRSKLNALESTTSSPLSDSWCHSPLGTDNEARDSDGDEQMHNDLLDAPDETEDVDMNYEQSEKHASDSDSTDGEDADMVDNPNSALLLNNEARYLNYVSFLETLCDSQYHEEVYNSDGYPEPMWEMWLQDIKPFTSLRAMVIGLVGYYNLFVLRRLSELTQLKTLCFVGHYFNSFPLYGDFSHITSLYLVGCHCFQYLAFNFSNLEHLAIHGEPDQVGEKLDLPWASLKRLEIVMRTIDPEFCLSLIEDIRTFVAISLAPLALTRFILCLTPDSTVILPTLEDVVDVLRHATLLEDLQWQVTDMIYRHSVKYLRDSLPQLVRLHIANGSHLEQWMGNVEDYADALQGLDRLECLVCNIEIGSTPDGYSATNFCKVAFILARGLPAIKAITFSLITEKIEEKSVEYFITVLLHRTADGKIDESNMDYVYDDESWTMEIPHWRFHADL